MFTTPPDVEHGFGREAARPCVSKEAEPAKIDSLIEKVFCARPLKDVSIFAGFAPPSGGELLGGLARSARQKPIRSGEAGRKRGVGKMNAHPALAFRRRRIFYPVANEVLLLGRANEVGAPHNNLIY